MYIFNRVWGVVALMAAAAAMPAAAQMAPENPDVGDAARSPLEDFNIDRDEIPAALIAAARDPFASDGLATCNDIVAQVAQLDQVLGSDFDIADAVEGPGITEGRVAQFVVRQIIPFRGLVREISGANEREREVLFAVTAGMVRRGFLKGLGQARGCNYPARPREARGSLTGSE